MATIEVLIDNLKAARDAVGPAKRQLLEKVGQQAAEAVKRATPVDSGRLKDSICHEVRDEQTISVKSEVEYAPYVDQGHTTKNGRFVPGRHMFEQALLTADAVIAAEAPVFFNKIKL